MILWHPPQMELWQLYLRPQHAQLHQKCPSKTPASLSQEVQRQPISCHCQTIWHKGPAHGPHRHLHPLPLHELKCLQQIIVPFLFYCHAIDPIIVTALSELSSNQATATEATKHTWHQFLNYCASHPDGFISYHVSNMGLKLHSDSSYLNAIRAHSRKGDHSTLETKWIHPQQHHPQSCHHHENGHLLC